MIWIILLTAVALFTAYKIGKAKQRAEFKRIGLKSEMREIWRRKHGKK